MKIVLVVVAAIAVAVKAKPYGPPIGMGQMGYSGGSGYGSGFGSRGEQGYQGGEYGMGGSQGGFENDHQDSHFTQITDSHQSVGHEAGGGMNYGAGGRGQAGYGAYDAAGQQYGQNFGSGFSGYPG